MGVIAGRSVPEAAGRRLLGHRRFAVVRPRHVGALTLLPEAGA
jgi:hypothetical protein